MENIGLKDKLNAIVEKEYIAEKEMVKGGEEKSEKKPSIKTINKNIRFNYFQSFLIVDKEIMDKAEKDKKYIEKVKERFQKKPSKELEKRMEEEHEILSRYNRVTSYQSTIWDIKEMLEYINENKMESTSINLGDIIVEIEPGSIIDINENIVGFQLTKMRDNMLPAKKKIGESKEEIILNDDEYIGDFVSILYDSIYKVLMVQSNSYGLTINQIEKYLTKLRRKYIEEAKLSTLVPEYACELRVLIDPKKVENILDAKYYRKLRIKGSDFMLDSLLDKDSNSYKKFGSIRNCIGETKGVNFDITLSVQSAKKTETLNHEEVKEFIEEFKSIKDEKNKPTIEVTKKDSDDSNTEVINLLYPRLTNIINFKIEPRTSIGNEFLFDKMKETYNKTRGTITRVVNKSK